MWMWNGMLAAFLGIVVYRVLSWGGVGKQTYALMDKTQVGSVVTLLTFRPLDGKPIPHHIPEIGQHFYMQWHRFGEAHPFTVMEYNKETGDMVFGIRTSGKFTKKIEKIEHGHHTLIDGPYGVFTQEAQNDEPKVIIAGGIGVTPFVDLVKYYGKGTTFLHANRSMFNILRRDYLIAAFDTYYYFLDGEESEGDEYVIKGRIDAEQITKIVGNVNVPFRKYFVCGSPFFIKIMKKTLMGMGVPSKNIYYEELGFL